MNISVALTLRTIPNTVSLSLLFFFFSHFLMIDGVTLCHSFLYKERHH